MLVAFVTSAKADVTRFEAEAGVAAELPLFDYQGGIPKGSAGLEMALRYNFQDSPWDCGVAIQLDCANRNYDPTYPDHVRNFRTVTIGVIGGYNFAQGKNINPFANLTAGVGINEEIGRMSFSSDRKYSAAFIPRVGVEFLHCIRLSAYSQLSVKKYDTYGITMGFVIGGWDKN